MNIQPEPNVVSLLLVLPFSCNFSEEDKASSVCTDNDFWVFPLKVLNLYPREGCFHPVSTTTNGQRRAKKRNCGMLIAKIIQSKISAAQFRNVGHIFTAQHEQRKIMFWQLFAQLLELL